jgi:hypothetical protein
MDAPRKKLNRKSIGSLYRAKDPTKPNYIKMRSTVTLKEGQVIRAESRKFQEQSMETAIAAGKMGGETAEKVRERLSKIPDYVLAELVILEEQQ